MMERVGVLRGAAEEFCEDGGTAKFARN